MRYDVLINVQFEEGRLAKHLRYGGEAAYQDGDRLVLTWSGEVPDGDAWALDPEVAAWAVVNRHNRDDRPDGQVGPSFSEGDVVRLWPADGLVCYASTGMDMVRVAPPTNVETRLTWTEAVDASRAIARHES